MQGLRTNISRKHEEVIVGETAILLGVDKCLDIDSILLRVLVLEYFEGLGIVQSIGGGVSHGVAVGNRHDERRSCFPKNREEYRRLNRTKQTSVVLQLWPGKIPVFPRRKRTRKVRAAEFVVGGVASVFVAC
jgi:hypothetical protein